MQRTKFSRAAVLLAAAALAAPAAARADYREVPVANGGKITGKLTFKGEVPAKAVETYPVPGKSPRRGTALRKVVTIDVKDGALRGAFVLLEGVTQGKKWPDRKAPPMLEQKDCVFLPSHQVVRAGSPLLIRNSDEATLHTVKLREVSQVSSGCEAPSSHAPSSRSKTSKPSARSGSRR